MSEKPIPTIQVLSEETSNQIAAGEVIERPASVVKEFIENSLDAKATNISIYIENGGLHKIHVVDNGHGMSEKDAGLALQRHATSKIQKSSDLASIATLGFRGEALPSIASVSKLEMKTKQKGALSGTYLYFEGGQKINEDHVGCPEGTSILIKDLFFNTPARKEFLRSVSAENASISDLVAKYALAYPEVAFRLTNKGKVIFQTTGQGDVLDVIMSIYGLEIARKMVSLQSQNKHITLEGFTAPAAMTRGNKKHISVFVNRRFVQCPLIDDAVLKAYGDLLPMHRYPITILNLHLKPEELDINVHPAKSEIRFHHGSDIYDIVVKSIKESLAQYNHTPDIIKSPAKENQQKQNQAVFSYDQKFTHKQDSNATAAEKSDEQSCRPDNKESTENQSAEYAYSHHDSFDIRIIGHVFSTYIAAEVGEEMLIVDQHAAQERVLYEKLMKDEEKKSPVQQKRLVPFAIELTPSEQEFVSETRRIFEDIGFQITQTSGRTILVHAIPAFIPEDQIESVIHQILEEVSSIPRIKTASFDFQKEKMITAACRSSVKAKDRITSEEMEEIIRQLFCAESPYTCPHGRPTMLRFSLTELEKRFKRI